MYYPAKTTRFICKTTSRRQINNDNSQQITIKCSQEENPDISGDPGLIDLFGPPDFWYWGTWNITVAADLNSAKAEWIDDNPENNGEALQCTVLSQELFEKSDLEFVFRKIREQAEFRNLLLGCDPSCAVTGETTREALEAAHIVEKREDGAEKISNGFLLRADIHRLYDRRFFEISEIDGSIERISDGLSAAYKDVLKDKKLSEEIFTRVNEALATRARLKQGR